MRVVRFDRPEEFLRAAGPFLERDEVVNSLPFGVVRACVEDPGRYPGPNYFATVERGGAVMGVAVRTHPHYLLYYAPPEAAAVVAEDVVRAGVEPSGVQGLVASADAFASEWELRTGVPARRGKDLRSFRLDAVIPAPPAPGVMRMAGEADIPLVGAWYRAFEKEAHAGVPGRSPEDLARRTVRAGRLYLWEAEGIPVALAGCLNSTPNGARVGPVYTPPEHRRRGYASALMGALSAHLLAEGKEHCGLFTDLANPISNSIYPKVGYRPVADYRDWEFTSGDRPGSR